MADRTRMPPQLVHYWTRGAGAAEIAWGTKGDFERCRAAIHRETHGTLSDRIVRGLCANLHRIATGHNPGQH